jgi:hypothetical protein
MLGSVDSRDFGELIANQKSNGCFLVVLSVAVCLKNLRWE